MSSTTSEHAKPESMEERNQSLMATSRKSSRKSSKAIPRSITRAKKIDWTRFLLWVRRS
jgi:hypothetical protein